MLVGVKRWIKSCLITPLQLWLLRVQKYISLVNCRRSLEMKVYRPISLPAGVQRLHVFQPSRKSIEYKMFQPFSITFQKANKRIRPSPSVTNLSVGLYLNEYISIWLPIWTPPTQKKTYPSCKRKHRTLEIATKTSTRLCDKTQKSSHTEFWLTQRRVIWAAPNQSQRCAQVQWESKWLPRVSIAGENRKAVGAIEVNRTFQSTISSTT